MRKPEFGVILMITLLSGCASIRGAARDTSYGAAIGATGAAAAAAEIAYLPVGRIIERRTRFVPESGGYAIILLRQAHLARNVWACEMMARSIRIRVGPPDSRPVIMDEMLVRERPVYWPVTKKTRANCRTMLQNYDFERASANLQRVGSLSKLGQGPFVLVRRANGDRAGFFDFSKVAVEDFDGQFGGVVNYMTQRADVWDPSFYESASFRQTLRYYLLDESGGAPTVVASLINLKGD